MTVEADGTGALYPVVYCRRDGRLEEHALPGHPLLDFATREHADALHAALVGGLPSAATAVGGLTARRGSRKRLIARHLALYD